MKRTLSKEALYHHDIPETDEQIDSLDTSLKEAPNRVRLVDPNGNRVLALLKEIEEEAPKPH